jgi:IS605 OrfB family transposase
VRQAYKSELDLNDRQITICRKHAGAARWAFNWGLRVKQEQYRAAKKNPTAVNLHRELNALKKQGKWKGKVGYPQFKTKKKELGSFRLHQQIRNQRSNTLHQVTTRLAKTKSALVIENLHVSGMLKNHHLAQAVGDVGFAEFKRQLLYKASWYGARVILADRWEPSSKRCSECGWIDKELTLSDRTFHRQQCGLMLDRDLNAALNLVQLAGSSSDSQNACGAASTGTR